MNPVVWLILIGGGLYVASKINASNKTSITITRVNLPRLQNGALVLSVNAAIDNPTNTSLNIKKPTLRVKYGKATIGNSIPTSEMINIRANDRTPIDDLNIQIPLSNIPGIAAALLIGQKAEAALDIEINTSIGGLPYTSVKRIQL